MGIQEQRWTGQAPPSRNRAGGGYVTIAWARVGYPVRFVSLSSVVYGSYVHWVGNRSVLCVTADEEVCSLCRNKWARRWYGWLLGVSIDTSATLLAQIPYESYCRAHSLHGGDLLGATVALHRHERNRRTVAVSVDKRRQPVDVAPTWREPDVGRMLRERYETFAAMRVAAEPTDDGRDE